MNQRRVLLILFVCLTAGCAAPDASDHRLRLTEQDSPTDQLLIGLAPVDTSVVWASGAQGVVLRTIDGGTTWERRDVPGADTLQFRDIHAADEERAWVMSAGSGSASRIYHTDDGGLSWMEVFQNEDPDAFYDCMDFWDDGSGIAFSDAVDGVFPIIVTNDGLSWRRVDESVLPPAASGEGSFAASGRCVQTVGDSVALIGTGAGASARLLRTNDRGVTWEAFETPIRDGTRLSGISSLSFLDHRRGFVFGLDLEQPDSSVTSIAETTDGGTTWTTPTPPQIPDVYGGTVVPDSDGRILVVSGPKGIDVSFDRARSWTSVTKLDHWGIHFASRTVGWAVGPAGRITKLTVVE